MAKPKRKWPRIAAMVLVALLLAASVILVLVDKFAPTQTLVPQSLVKLPSTVVATVMNPFQSAVSWATNGIKGYLDMWKLRKTIEIEYNKMLEQNELYAYQTLYVQKLEEENERLTRYLDLYDDRMEETPIMARVIDKEPGNWFQKFTINKGEADDIEPLMAVINTDGLIGYVDTVYETSSEVIAIIDSRARVAGVLESSRDQGIVQGTLGIDDEAVCRMYYLPTKLSPRPGDRVTTSGIGEPFPKGIGIGEIRESTRYMDENKHYVVIEPYVDFEHIEEVMVLVYRPSREETPEGDDGQINYVPGVLDTMRPYPGIGEQLGDENLGAVTPPPRTTRAPADGEEANVEDMPPEDTLPGDTPEPGATPSDTPAPQPTNIYWIGGAESGGAPTPTPTPDPELDALMREELEQDREQEGY